MSEHAAETVWADLLVAAKVGPDDVLVLIFPEHVDAESLAKEVNEAPGLEDAKDRILIIACDDARAYVVKKGAIE